ncbi:hypothetical protein [Micromonospora sp. WMMD710]|uniref:hypothetical protein n=1 Tax=Micromonospora sp. WMMD710 TaxID=3016085 RepID=UPI002416F5DB|nr:hypothetical protein [Micromonospora sp. WMMD710]MDG4756489.1 hypothetical protein [Micromonospora sp. WMMD710]
MTVGNGELFGLLGPNGAGTTATIELLSTLLIPTARGGRPPARPRRSWRCRRPRRGAAATTS